MYIIYLYPFNIYRIQSFSAFFQFEGHFVIFLYIIHQAWNMHEVFVVRFCVLNEAKTSGLIKKFYFSFFHNSFINLFLYKCKLFNKFNKDLLKKFKKIFDTLLILFIHHYSYGAYR